MEDELIQAGGIGQLKGITPHNSTQSPTIGALAGALAKAQGAIQGAAKGAENPFYKSKYADLASVWDACRAALSENELAVIQTNSGDTENVVVITTLAHSSGEWIKGTLPMSPTKSDPQGVGSCITYARRYALAAMVGVAPEDDDGNAASQAPTVKIKQSVVKDVVTQSRACIESSDEHGLKEVWAEFDADEKVVLWGKFNSQERSTMKKMMSGD